MILLNKFIFGKMDQFKESLSNISHIQETHLSKSINIFCNYRETYVRCFDKKLRISKYYVSYTNYTFIEQLNIRFMYEKYNILDVPVVNIYFTNHKDNTRLCILTTNSELHYHNYHNYRNTCSDDKSIENVMNTLRNKRSSKNLNSYKM